MKIFLILPFLHRRIVVLEILQCNVPRKKTARKRRRLSKAVQSKHRLSALTVAELLVDRIIEVLRCVRIRTGATADEHPSSTFLDVQHLP